MDIYNLSNKQRDKQTYKISNEETDKQGKEGEQGKQGKEGKQASRQADKEIDRPRGRAASSGRHPSH
jgi:hypothetical protein